jgi:hypothetical protein
VKSSTSGSRIRGFRRGAGFAAHKAEEERATAVKNRQQLRIAAIDINLQSIQALTTIRY